VLLCQLFLGLPLPLEPYGFHIRAALQGSRSFFRNVWPVHLNLRCLISILMLSWLLSFQRPLNITIHITFYGYNSWIVVRRIKLVIVKYHGHTSFNPNIILFDEVFKYGQVWNFDFILVQTLEHSVQNYVTMCRAIAL
jgi:hypothetical protein